MLESGILSWMAFLAASSSVLLLSLLVSGRRSRLDNRLRELSGRGSTESFDSVADFARSALPKMGTALLPKSAEERTRLQTRLLHAGLYSRQAMAVFFGVKVCLMVGPALLGLMAGLIGLVPTDK